MRDPRLHRLAPRSQRLPPGGSAKSVYEETPPENVARLQRCIPGLAGNGDNEPWDVSAPAGSLR